MRFSVLDSTPAQGSFCCLTDEIKDLHDLHDSQKGFRTDALAVDAILLKSPFLSDCLDAIDQKCGFTGDAAVLALSWALAAARTEREVG